MLTPEKLRYLVELLGQQTAETMLADREKAFSIASRQARTIDQQLGTIAAHHAPEVWRAFVSKSWGSALGLIAAFKAQDSTAIDRALEAVRMAYDAGDDAAFADAIKALDQLRPQQQQAGPKQYRMSDTTARAPVTKELSAEALLDGVSTTLKGGH